MLSILAVALICVTLIAFVWRAEAGVFAAMLSAPVVAMSWDVAFVDVISAPRILGVAVPLVVLFRLMSGGRKFASVPLLGIWTVYTLYGLVPSAVVSIDKGLISGIEVGFRILNGLVGYVMLQTWCNTRESFRRLLIVLMVAGVAPMAVPLWQQATGVVFRDVSTVGLVRLVGLYHDSQSVRFFAFQTLTALILYWAYFRPAALRKVVLLSYALVCGLVLFKTYSKAGTVIAVAWVLIWSIGRRRLVPAVLVVGILAIANAVFYPQVWTETEQLFAKELAAAEEGEGEGELSEETRERTLAGRWIAWEYLLDKYASRSLPAQIFGGGSTLAAHNDYLGALLEGGIVGLAIYLTLLISIGKRIVSNCRRDRSPLNIMAVMLFAMWLVDTIGLTPRNFSSYQWYVWGFIGLSFRGIDWRTAAERVAGRDAAAAPKPEPAPGYVTPAPATNGPVKQQPAHWPRARPG